MEDSKHNSQPLYPFLHAKPSKAQHDEDAFMIEHGTMASRAIYLAVVAISGLGNALFIAPFNWLLDLIDYESPLSSKRLESPDVDRLTRKSKSSRQRRKVSKNCANADPLSHPKSKARRRA